MSRTLTMHDCFFAWPPENVNHAIPLAVLSLDGTGLMDRYFLTGAMAPVYCGSSFPPFSLYWFVKDKVPYSIMGDGAISSSFHFFVFSLFRCRRTVSFRPN